MSNKDISGRVKLRELKILSDNHYTLRRADFDYQRSDGSWQPLSRECYDMGDGAAVLPIDKAREKLVQKGPRLHADGEAGFR